MKNHIEIIESLDICGNSSSCFGCHYYNDSRQHCQEDLMVDALNYIRQLESQIVYLGKMDPMKEPHDPGKCRYYISQCERCLGTKELDPCKGENCERWTPKDE